LRWRRGGQGLGPGRGASEREREQGGRAIARWVVMSGTVRSEGQSTALMEREVSGAVLD